jgi:hypothetical protein
MREEKVIDGDQRLRKLQFKVALRIYIRVKLLLRDHSTGPGKYEGGYDVKRPGSIRRATRLVDHDFCRGENAVVMLTLVVNLSALRRRHGSQVWY